MANQTVHPDSDLVQVAIPRSALTVVERPRAISQRTSERVIGIPARAYLDLLAPYRAGGGVVLVVGKLRIVEVDPFMSWLARRDAARPVVSSDAETDVERLERRLGIVAVRS